MRSIRFTDREIKALITIVDERITGGVDDLADAIGCDSDEAANILEDAESALDKLKKG